VEEKEKGGGEKINVFFPPYHGIDILFTAKDNLGHRLDIKGRTSALSCQVSWSCRFVAVDSMAMEARLDREVFLDSRKASLSSSGHGKKKVLIKDLMGKR
jgi:hypothetical protein